MNNDKQVRSRQRVSDHGEVFTSEREVNAMLDMVKHETERIDSRFLEPACGNGNFLAEVLRRKLAVVRRRYKNSPANYEKFAVLAISSVYGVEILPDNVAECRKRLFEIFDREYASNFSEETNSECREAVRFILSRNILCGDALTLKEETGRPIIFSEWSFVTAGMLKRRDFRLDEMLDGSRKQMTLDMSDWQYDEEIRAFIPLPTREFPPIYYRKVYQHHDE